MSGEFLVEGGSGTSRAGIGEALTGREGNMGEAATERGRGAARALIGETSGEWDCCKEVELRGVEWVDDDESEGVLVRVREGVRVFRERGRLNETLRSLSYGDG